jgi:hypothetical protein
VSWSWEKGVRVLFGVPRVEVEANCFATERELACAWPTSLRFSHITSDVGLGGVT